MVEPTTGANDAVFATRDAMGDLETTTLKSTRDEAQKLAAKCFQVIEGVEDPKNKEEMTTDFIKYLAEIRRAHNDSATT